MDRTYQADIAVPAGTSALAPLTTQVQLENAFLVDIEIFIPPGHAGLTGINIRQSGQQILPFANLSWIIADNYSRIFPVNVEIGSRSISVRTYNTDVFVHAFYVRFHIQDLTKGGGQPPSAAGGSLANVISEGLLNGDIDGNPVPPPGSGGDSLPSLPPPPPILNLPPL